MENLEINKIYNDSKISIKYSFSDKRYDYLRPDERFDVIKYPKIWSEIISLFHNVVKDSIIVIELYPVIASSWNTSVEDDINELKDKFGKEQFFNCIIDGGINLLCFKISSLNDLKDLVYSYFEADQLIIYFFDDKFNFVELKKLMSNQNVSERNNQFNHFNKLGCLFLAQFINNGIKMEITLDAAYEGNFNLFLRGLK